MGRNKKIETAKVEEPVADVATGVEETPSVPESQPEAETTKVEEIEKSEETPVKDNKSDEISPRDLELMRLYPQYEEIWITPDGFVHPKGASAFLLKGAKLYKNKFYNK